MTTIFFGAVLLVIAIALVLIALTLVAIYGLLTGVQRQFIVATGALSMLATTFDERDPANPEERVFFKNLYYAIYHGLVDGRPSS